jgi:tetratricopeptide (TPR) repeat protein
MRTASWLAIWLAVTLLSAIAPLSVSTQTLPGEIERDDIKRELRRYHDLVVDYRRGAADVADRVLGWDAKRLGRVLASIDGVSDETRPWVTVRFKAAAMMHTDAALRLLDRGEVDAAPLHIDAASRLLEKAGLEARPFAARWYQASARLLRDRGLFPRAEQFLETARVRLPRDSTVLYESATLQELLATNTVLPNIVYLPDLKAPPPSPQTSTLDSTVRVTREDIDDLKRRRAGQLNRAAGWLRESLAADGSNMRARLHLGRVQSLRNQGDDALKLLRQASESQDPAIGYLALLFTGAVHEREGLLAASVQDYRAAIERFPLNHAAHIALSAALQRSGRGDESRDILGRVVNSTAASRRDPWWTYLAEPASVNVGRLDLLRREARQ